MKLSIPYVSIKYIRNKNFRRQCPLKSKLPGKSIKLITVYHAQCSFAQYKVLKCEHHNFHASGRRMAAFQ